MSAAAPDDQDRSGSNRPPVVFRPGCTAPRSHNGTRVTPDRLGEGVGAGTEVVSLDVFDTVVTRACGSPSDLFLWLGRRLAMRAIIDMDAEVFALARTRAEAVVWAREGGLDSHADLLAIYTELTDALGLEPSRAGELAALEFELERELSRPVVSSATLGELAADRRLVLTTDTYFTPDQVRDLLDLHGLSVHADELLVSSNVAASKASGRLFLRLLSETGSTPGGVTHIGDNPHSDVDVPLAMGLHAAWAPDARLNRFEQLLSRDVVATAGLAGALAGASRAARLAVTVGSDHERAIRDVAAGVAAPALIGYILWIIHRAQALGLRRLFFLARDGQILHDIATRLVTRLGVDLDLHYLAVSRRSTNLAATFDVSRDETDWVFRDAPLMTVSEVLQRFGLVWDDVAGHLEAGDPGAGIGPGEVGPDAPWPVGTEVGRRLRRLIENGVLRDLVLANAERERSVVNRFLEQEGLLDDHPTGIVDFGGVGSQMRSLHTLVAATGVQPPKILLVGLDDPAAAGLMRPPVDPEWVADTHTWLYDHRRGRGRRRKRGFGTCFQMFTAADHGSVTGYAEVGGGALEPVFTVATDRRNLEWGLDIVRSAVAEVTERVVLDVDLVDARADLRDVTVELVDELWTRPTRAEAAAWGTFPFEGAQATPTEAAGLAHPYTLGEVARGIAEGYFPNLGWQHWYEGSLALSPLVVRAGLRSAERGFTTLRAIDNPAGQRLVSWARSRRPSRRPPSHEEEEA